MLIYEINRKSYKQKGENAFSPTIKVVGFYA